MLQGCHSAIAYLHSKQFLHKDIMRKKLPPMCASCRPDLGKPACSVMLLLSQDENPYANIHPQIAPEVVILNRDMPCHCYSCLHPVHGDLILLFLLLLTVNTMGQGAACGWAGRCPLPRAAQYQPASATFDAAPGIKHYPAGRRACRP